MLRGNGHELNAYGVLGTGTGLGCTSMLLGTGAELRSAVTAQPLWVKRRASL